jgi:hypothetical protein
MDTEPTYEGVAETLEAAVQAAHDQIPFRDGRDFTVSKVIDWGMQFGGFAGARSFYAVVKEDPDAPFRT